MSLFGFIDAERAIYPVSLLCRAPKVSRSGYYAWPHRPPPRGSVEGAPLAGRIREAHERSRRTYGYPRVHAELGPLGVECGRRRVARLTREDGLRGRMRGRRRAATHRDKDASAAPDLVDRRFLAASPDRLWLAGITCLPTREGFLRLAFILDACSRRVAGWAMAGHLRAELVAGALETALWRRSPLSGVAHHSDRGSQYTAPSFGERLKEAGAFPSMGRAGSALDNAMAESFVSALKAEMGGLRVRRQGGRRGRRPSVT